MTYKLLFTKINKFITLRCYVTKINERIFSNLNVDDNLLTYLSVNLKISKNKVILMFLKNPNFRNLKKDKVEELIKILKDYNIDSKTILYNPKILNLFPRGIDRRAKVLEECGFQNFGIVELSKFMSLMTRKSLSELKSSRYILPNTNIQDRLTKCLSAWPCFPPMPKSTESLDTTLMTLRMKILERYLELVLNLQPEIFQRGINTYSRIKSRPLSNISLTLEYLRNTIKMPDKYIKTNLFVLYTDPAKIHRLLNEVKTLSGIDIEDLIIKKPAILINNVDTLLNIQKLLSDYNISLDSQHRSMEIYTLSLETVQKRLADLTSLPEYRVYFKNPRFLQLVVHKKRADKRLEYLKKANKRNFTLSVLTNSEFQFNAFDLNPAGSRTRDLINTIYYGFGEKYSIQKLHNKIKRHKLARNISIINVKITLEQLSKRFSEEEIFMNCYILLYPWERIHVYLLPLHKANEAKTETCDIPITLKNKNVNLVLCKKLTNAQILNLVLYFVEIEYNFSGNGIWQLSVLYNGNLYDMPEINSL